MISKRTLGADGLRVGALGYGAMVLEGYYGAADEKLGIRAIQHAIDMGLNMIDSADAYGNGHNEELVGKAIRSRRNETILATKFGIVFEKNESGTELPTGWGFSLRINGTPEYAQRALNQSLRRLNVDAIDLWYLHYADPVVSIEETVGAMAKAVEAGKVRYLGLSNVTAAEVKRAQSVHPVAVVQYEYSLWRREIERELLPTLRGLGIGLVPWSPLGAGFLTGTVEKLSNGDFRRNNPKFTGNNLRANLDRFAPLRELAVNLNLTPAQLALAWLLHQGNDIVPIPGTRKIARIDENAHSASLVLDKNTLRRMDEIMPIGAAVGNNLV